VGGGWGHLAHRLLARELWVVGILGTARTGAALYTAGHSHLGPALLAAATLGLGGSSEAVLVALVWVAHIGFDRMAGYGLKHASSFFDTHLGRVGRRAGRDAVALTE